MEFLRVTQIRAGRAFDQDLFLPTGQKLIAAGVELTPRHIQAIHRCGEMELVLAQGLEELAAAGLLDRAKKSDFAVGRKARHNIMTGAGQVLLEAGEKVEQHHLEALREAGGAFQDHDEAQTAGRRERVLMADILVDELKGKIKNLPLRVKPNENDQWIHPAPASDWPVLADLSKQRDGVVDDLRQMFAKIEAGVNVPICQFQDVLDGLIRQLSQHPQRFTQLALLCRRREDYLPDHAYTVSVIAMAVAANMKWSQDDVRQVGLAGLLYDLGMLLIPERIRTGACELTDIDRNRVQRHPVFSLSMLQAISDVPLIVQLVALQHQERENGSGYPFGTRKNMLCDHARIIAVADAFAAITAPRHYRKTKLPYVAMEETLRYASAQIFWPLAVRALVQSAGLFPVGSYVKLSNGQIARVLESNPSMVDRPVVQPVENSGSHIGKPVDLSNMNKETLCIVRPMPSASGQED